MTSTSGESPITESATCPCSGATLDKLTQPAILVVLAEGELHGYRIAERIAAMPPFEGEKPDVSGVYRSLRTLEERSVVAASWDVSARGPAKRLYRLTPTGRECLSRWVDTLDGYRQAVGSLLALARRAVRRVRSGSLEAPAPKEQSADA